MYLRKLSQKGGQFISIALVLYNFFYLKFFSTSAVLEDWHKFFGQVIIKKCITVSHFYGILCDQNVYLRFFGNKFKSTLFNLAFFCFPTHNGNSCKLLKNFKFRYLILILSSKHDSFFAILWILPEYLYLENTPKCE